MVVNPYTVTDSGYSGGVLLDSRADVEPGAGDVPTEPVSDLPCTDGTAGPFPCENVDLNGFLPIAALNAGASEDVLGDPVELNDIWGWADPRTGREYALVGKTHNIAINEQSGYAYAIGTNSAGRAAHRRHPRPAVARAGGLRVPGRLHARHAVRELRRAG